MAKDIIHAETKPSKPIRLPLDFPIDVDSAGKIITLFLSNRAVTRLTRWLYTRKICEGAEAMLLCPTDMLSIHLIRALSNDDQELAILEEDLNRMEKIS